MSNITFTKLKTSGNWGLRSLGTELVPGSSVKVAKRDGTTSDAVVGVLVWKGNDKATGQVVALYELAPKAPKTPAPAPVPATPAPRKARYVPCGYPGCNPAHCDECDGLGRYGEA